MNKTKYDAIIFDLDGTLWDSTKEIYDSWVQVLKEQPDVTRIPSLEEQQGVMGLSDDILMEKLFPELSVTRRKELFDLCCEVENVILAQKGGKAYEGITEMLAQLSNEYPLSIVSNCNDGYIEAYFKGMGTAEYFADYESFGRTGKPKWENIKAVVDRNGYQNPVYVGDTLWDMESATKAGVPFIHARYGFCKDLDSAMSIETPLQLTEILK